MLLLVPLAMKFTNFVATSFFMSEVASLSIQTFSDYLKYQKRYSRHTILSYQNDLISFFDFITLKYGDFSLPDITSGLVRTWLASLKEQQISSKSINRKISTLRSFF